MNYSQKIDQHFPKYFNYRTLRCIFDPKVSEWHRCNMEKKLEILGNLLTIKPLEYWVNSYAKYYKSLKKEYVLVDIPEALFRMYQAAQITEEYQLVEAIHLYLVQSQMRLIPGFRRVYKSENLVSLMGPEFEKHQKAHEVYLQKATELLASYQDQYVEI